MGALSLSSNVVIAARSAMAVSGLLSTGGMGHLAARMVSSPSPSLGDAMSGIFGSISLTAWICLLMPQLIQNYKSQSAEGLSMAFLFVWMVGDIANLSGALLTGLAPTAIALAIYFCFADIILIAQCLYYNTLNARRAAAAAQQHAHHERRRRRSSSTAVADDADADDEGEGEEDEDGPLLSRRRSSSVGLPGSHRRHSIRHSESNIDPLRRIITGEDETPDSNPWIHNALSLLAVYVVGTLGYFASYRMGAWDAEDPATGGSEDGGASLATDGRARLGLVLGYISAASYLCARIPQIIKNYQQKSCEGLALLFFLLSLTGNFTYGISLVAYSQESDYLLKALPWLLGSLGTIAEDSLIFVQFRLYSPKRQSKAARAEVAVTEGAVGAYGAV